MKVNKRNPLHWYHLGLQALFTLVALALRPLLSTGTDKVVVLYGHQLSGHLAAIYDYWNTHRPAGIVFYFLSLNPAPALRRPTDDKNILFCHRIKDMLVVARAAAIITDHGLHMMAPLVRLTDIAFIDVGHGIPFKGYDEADFRLQHRYTEIWTSSEGISKLYAAKCGCADLVHTIGAPRTDKLVNKGDYEGRFRAFVDIPSDNPVILYAPTWQQDDKGRALVPFGQTETDFLASLSNFCQQHDCYLVFRSHQNATFSERPFDRIVFCPQTDYPDTEEILLDTNILISDWSSIVFDYLVLDRPTIFLDVPHPFLKGCTLGPEYRFGHIAGTVHELLTALDMYIHNPDVYMTQHRDKHESVKSFVYDKLADGRTSERCLSRLHTLLV